LKQYAIDLAVASRSGRKVEQRFEHRRPSNVRSSEHAQEAAVANVILAMVVDRGEAARDPRGIGLSFRQFRGCAQKAVAHSHRFAHFEHRLGDPAKPRVRVHSMEPRDWPVVRAIYEAGIATANATFETRAPDWDQWDRTHLAGHRLVATDDVGDVVGWVALSPVSDRCAYRGVTEDSVYVHPRDHRQGVGTVLLERLVAASEQAGYWTIQTGIFPENTASLTLHRRVGSASSDDANASDSSTGSGADTYLLERRSAQY
jgi:phosphinothricin acetyltransferase